MLWQKLPVVRDISPASYLTGSSGSAASLRERNLNAVDLPAEANCQPPEIRRQYIAASAVGREGRVLFGLFNGQGVDDYLPCAAAAAQLRLQIIVVGRGARGAGR